MRVAYSLPFQPMKKKTKKVSLDRKKGLYLRHVEGKGRGVFCVAPIKKGEVLEVTPTIILNERATDRVDSTILANYTFQLGAVSKTLRREAGAKKMSGCSGVIMGIISYFNHSETPNAEVQWEEHGGTLYHQVVAIKNIPKDTEICTSYGRGWFEDRKDTVVKRKH